LNKINVAVSLLQLLNERKKISSKLVSSELNVGIRTAQRYLVELSRMPCVIYDEVDRSYSLNPDYKLSEVLVNGQNHIADYISTNIKAADSNQFMCLYCGGNRNYSNRMGSSCNNKNLFSNKNMLDKLISTIKKSLNGKKCSFP